jgi:capsid protein
MGVFDFLTGAKVDKLEKDLIEANSRMGNYNPLFNISYDGEKNSGELGALTQYDLDYRGLRYRSWESYLTNPITQTIVNRYLTWIIGGGLKLQCEPISIVLDSENIKVPDSFIKTTEARFKIFAESIGSDYAGVNNLNRLSWEIKKNAIIGGDVLVIQRVDKKGNLNVQAVDGQHVATPFMNDEAAKAKARGNTIKNGIEESKTGEHIAYYIRTKPGKFVRVEAKGKNTKRDVAFMVYGLRYRLDDNRGIPLISTVLETLAKLDRYKEATVGSAEERAKIVYAVEHQQFSSGENPLARNLVKAFNVDADQDIPVTEDGKKIADTIAASTDKQVFNLPLGAKLAALDTKNDIYFKEFYGVNVEAICSALGIPPEVALSKFDSNYSASRAALKDWEHTINVARKDFQFQFNQKIYNTWLNLDIQKNKTQAPGYLTALVRDDETVLAAYRNARFTGANVPHIDPEKEVRAERLKLGETGAAIPLTTVEQATENVNGGEFATNIEKYSKELQLSKDKGIELEKEIITQPAGTTPVKKVEK